MPPPSETPALHTPFSRIALHQRLALAVYELLDIAAEIRKDKDELEKQVAQLKAAVTTTQQET